MGAPGGCWSPERERVMSIHAYMFTYMQKHITNNIRTYIGLTQAVGTPLFGCCFQGVLPWFCVSMDASCGNPLFRFCSQRALPWCCVSIDASCGNPPLQILFSEFLVSAMSGILNTAHFSCFKVCGWQVVHASTVLHGYLEFVYVRQRRYAAPTCIHTCMHT